LSITTYNNKLSLTGNFWRQPNLLLIFKLFFEPATEADRKIQWFRREDYGGLEQRGANRTPSLTETTCILPSACRFPLRKLLLARSIVQRLHHGICIGKIGINPKENGNDDLAALMLCIVGFTIVGSYPEIPDN
jgi:hypothetical protein